METTNSQNPPVEELTRQIELIREEISRSREVSDSNQSEAVNLLEEALQAYQRIEARMEASDDMLNRAMSLTFWVQLTTLLVLVGLTVSFFL
jgi:glycine cleavage system regulatory protein